MNITALKNAGAFIGLSQTLENITVKKQEKFNELSIPENVVYSIYKGKGQGKCIAATRNYDEAVLFDIYAKETLRKPVSLPVSVEAKLPRFIEWYWYLGNELIFTDDAQLIAAYGYVSLSPNSEKF